ncbi:MAG: VCBS repeat-containing protein [Calditrichaeota bacterium]|nr:VCBS repeat-containing protein [Calditrichota bacterium]
MNSQRVVGALLWAVLAASTASAQYLNIDSVFPAPFANHVAPAEPIRIMFDQPLDEAFLSPATFIVTGSQSGPLDGTLSATANQEAVFTPDPLYRPGETVSFTITMGLRGINGDHLERGHSYSFVVAAVAPPEGSVFSQRVISGTSTQGREIRALDYDHDRDLDLVNAHEGVPERLIVTENLGDGVFCSFDTGGNFRLCSVFDIDGDGDYDNFGATGAFDTVLNWFENEGSPPYTEHLISVEDPWTIVGGDLDSDGDADVLAAVLLPNRLLWWANDGAGNFAAPVSIPTSFGGGSDSWFTLCDINGDAAMDILAFHRDDYNVVWYENDGSQNFTEHLIENAPDRGRLASGDLDDDGDVDIVIVSVENSPTRHIGWYENDGAESFSYHNIDWDGVGRLYTVDIADLDGDQDMDILGGGAQFINDGAQNFTGEVFGGGLGRNGNSYANGLSHADLDQDGDTDILVIGLYALAWYENNPVIQLLETLPANGAASVAPDVGIALQFDQALDAATVGTEAVFVRSPWRGEVPGSFSLDGSDRLIFTPDQPFLAGERIEVSVNDRLLSTSGHNLGVTQGFQFTVASAPAVNPAFEPHPIHTHDGNLVGLDLADIDGDGDLDLATCSWTELLWHENDGSGSFDSHFLTATDTPVAVHLLDEDGDGDMDLWVDNNGSTSSELLRNDGDQNFSAENITGALRVRQIKDCNHDGDLDVLYGSYVDNRLNWLDGNCGNYTGYGWLPTVYANSALSADMDNDGVDDMLLAASQGVFALENDGWRIHTQRSINATSSVALAVADLDGDGDLDPLVVESFSGLVWHENLSTSDSLHFGPAQEIGALSQDPRDLVAADLDGDGDPDVAVVSRNGDQLVWQLNRLAELEADFGPQSFAPVAGDGYTLLRSGDLDGDGDIDLITISDGDDQLIWWENTGITAVREPAVQTRAGSLALWPVVPNPFNPSTTVQFELPVAGQVRLAVYNAAGQLVRTLLDENRAAGEYSVLWEGLNESNAPVASGLYLLRLEAGGEALVRKAVLLR